MPIEDLFKIRGNLLKGHENRRIKVLGHGTSVAFSDDLESLRVVKGRFVRPLTSQGVILVNEHDDPSFKEDLLAFKPARVSAPVPPLVVVQRDGCCLLDIGIV